MDLDVGCCVRDCGRLPRLHRSASLFAPSVSLMISLAVAVELLEGVIVCFFSFFFPFDDGMSL